MRICVVSDQAFPAWGGEGVATQNLCIRLSQRGHKVLFLTSKVPHPPQVKNIEIVRFPSFYIPQKGYFALALSFQIVPLLRERKIQIIHVNLPTFLGWQSFLAAKKLNVPCVAGFHVQVENVIPHNFFLFPCLKKIVEFWFSSFYKMADLLISPSNLGKRILSRYTSKKVEVISNGVDFEVFKCDFALPGEERGFREKFGLEDLPFLLYVGRLSREKNVFYLLEIMRVLKEENFPVRLVLVGKGELRKELEEKAHLKGLDEELIFTGFLPKEDLLSAYREADIFILPSLYELQSIVVLEAMAMGKAILVAKNTQSAACEMIKEGVNGYTFDLKDPFDAANKIKFILSHPSLKDSMQKASLALAKEHDITESISKIEKLYHQFL